MRGVTDYSASEVSMKVRVSWCYYTQLRARNLSAIAKPDSRLHDFFIAAINQQHIKASKRVMVPDSKITDSEAQIVPTNCSSSSERHRTVESEECDGFDSDVCSTGSTRGCPLSVREVAGFANEARKRALECFRALSRYPNALETAAAHLVDESSRDAVQLSTAYFGDASLAHASGPGRADDICLSLSDENVVIEKLYYHFLRIITADEVRVD